MKNKCLLISFVFSSLLSQAKAESVLSLNTKTFEGDKCRVSITSQHDATRVQINWHEGIEYSFSYPENALLKALKHKSNQSVNYFTGTEKVNDQINLLNLSAAYFDKELFNSADSELVISMKKTEPIDPEDESKLPYGSLDNVLRFVEKKSGLQLTNLWNHFGQKCRF